jgi:hypothetical protein
MSYAIRSLTHSVLEGRIGYLLKRAVGQPAREVCRYFSYRAQSWNKPHRVVAK